MKTLRSLFLNELADMYDSERRIARTWPKFIKVAPSDKLQRALTHHLEETQEHAVQIERIFASFDEVPRSKECPTMVSILSEGERNVMQNQESPALEETIISVCQKVEHYEIASYATLRACAKSLGNELAINLIDEILDQEREADHALEGLESIQKEDLETAFFGK